MLYGDKNMCLLICNGKIIISRLDSTIIYDIKSLDKDIVHTSFKFPRSFNNKIYDYSSGKMASYSVLTGQQDADSAKACLKVISLKEFQHGNIKDFFKQEKSFFFIKSSKSSTFSLFSKHSTTQSIADFNSWYCFSKGYIFIVVNQELIKMNLDTMEKEAVMRLKVSPVLLACEANTDGAGPGGDLVAIADKSNRIHIFCGETYRQYHWLSKKAENISFYEDFVVVASKDGKLAKFHSRIHKIQMLCEFVGSFIDLKIENSVVYLLTDIQLVVFSLESENILFSELLMPVADFSVVKANPVAENDKDMFNLKKRSRIEIHNRLGDSTKDLRHKKTQICKSACNFFIGFAKENHVFLFDPLKKVFSSFFSLESNISFVSNNRVFSVSQRKNNFVVKTFTISQDCLVLEACSSFSFDGKLNVKKAFMIGDKIFLVGNDKIYRINKLNLLEEIKSEADPMKIREMDNGFFILDDKGIFDISNGSYVIKQKKIVDFVFLKDMLVFYIENKGFYIDPVERILILEINGVIDIKNVISADERPGENGKYLSAIYLENGKYYSGLYDLNENKVLTLIHKSNISPNCHKILVDGIFTTKSGQMIFQAGSL